MTEAEWLAADDSGVLLSHLRGRVSGRKLRLFAVACCRRISHPMLGEQGREAIKTAARHADGLATDKELSDSQIGAMEEWDRLGKVDGIWRGPEEENPFEWVACEVAEEAAFQALDWAAGLVGSDTDDWQPRYESERVKQVPILRDIAGNPFRPVAVDSAWVTPMIVAIANGIYAEEMFDGLPVLADALEEAGCTDAEILAHCRSSGPHVRGCWVLDLLLSKE